METLSIRLLGTIDIRIGEQPIEGFISSKAQALLIYLAMAQHPVARTPLATLFWGDWGETAARRSLSKALSNLRQLVGGYLLIERHTVAFRAEQAHWRDVAAFEALLDGTAPSPSANALTALQQAVALYQGEFLEGFYVASAPDFEAWVRTERERLHQRCYDALAQLSHLTSHANEVRQAICWTQQLLRLEPTDEKAHRRLMVLYMGNGQRSSALAQYELCRNILADELDVAPATETVALYGAIRQGHQTLYTKESIQQNARLPTTAFDRPTAIASLVAPAPPAIPWTDEAAPRSTVQVSTEPPFVGRRESRQRIISAWQQCVAGQPHFCLIRGEAGIGKTRLAEEMLQWVSKRGIAVARARAYAAAGELAYTPMIDWLRSPPLQQALTMLDPIRLAELARLLPELVPLHPPRHTETTWSPAPTDSQWQRQRLFEALARALQAGTTPKVLLLDDLQWCDRETLAWLHYFMQAAQSAESNSPLMAPLLIIATARPEILHEAHPFLPILLHLRSTGIMTEIDLEPLDDVATAALAEEIAPQPLTPAQSAKLYGYTEGNPLFLIETLRSTAWHGDVAASTAAQHTTQERHSSGSAAGASGPPQPPLPAKVQAVIEERLASLSPLAHQLAGLASVVGRSFQFALLQAASPEAEALVIEGLHELWQQGIVRAHGSQHYDFSHDRIREVAYLTVGPVQRPLWHRRVAEALEALHNADLMPVSAQLAFHWETAGEVARAIEYYLQAAERTQAIFADEETLRPLYRALALVELLPPTRHNKKRELAILLQLRAPLMVAKGYDEPTLGTIGLRAKELAEEIGSREQLIGALHCLRIFYQIRAEYSKARSVADQMVALADPTEPSLFIVAHQLLAHTFFYQGELTSAQVHFDKILQYPSVPVQPLIFIAKTRWLFGYPDQAQQYADLAMKTARSQHQPHVHAFAVVNLARLYLFMHQFEAMKQYVEKALTLDATKNNRLFLILCLLFQGRLLAEEGEVERGIGQIQAMLTKLDEKKQGAFRTHFLGLLAEVYACTGQYADALDSLSQALSFVERNGERVWHAELVRLQGEYRLALGAPLPEVANCYEEAIAIAQAQQAKSLELRATMSLARLRQQQGEHAAAYAQLAEIYNWFTEGFNTADLRAAKALLAELAQTSQRDG